MASLSTSGGVVSIGGLSPFQAVDAWAAASDGRVAIVYADPYHVEWSDPSGGTVTGPPIDYEPVKLTREDQEAWADGLGRLSATMIVSSRAGGGNRNMRLPRPDPDAQDWPEYKPPFPREAASVTPWGALWVRRHVPHGGASRFDVFDGSANRVRSVTLPAGRRLVGFGVDTIYLVNVDHDDLQWLEAYRRP
jgi:hypothetical protein